MEKVVENSGIAVMEFLLVIPHLVHGDLLNTM